MSLQWGCLVCHAKKGQDCQNTIQPCEPLPGRTEHLARRLPPNPKESK